MINISNILSYSRIFCTGLINIFVYYNYLNYAVFFTIFASISDFFDGYLARKFKINTEYGAKLDLIADKVFSINMLILISYNSTFILNIIIIYLLIFREISMIIIRNIHKKNIPSSKFGKIKTVILNLAYILFFIHKPSSFILLYLGAVFSTISQLQYINNEHDKN